MTDRAQYGFQAGIQVTQAALSVMATIKKDIDFVVVLDLAKAYGNILKLLMESKLRSKVDDKLTNQLIVFLLTVQAQVSGDITNTVIAMLRGLTQCGTSPPALFRVFINELPEQVRRAFQERGQTQGEVDPIRLFADDVIGLTRTQEGLKTLLRVCKKMGGQKWSPMEPYQVASNQNQGRGNRTGADGGARRGTTCVQGSS